MLPHGDGNQQGLGQLLIWAGERHHSNGERTAASVLDEYWNKLEVANVHLAIARMRDRKGRPGILRKGSGRLVEKVGFGGLRGEQPGVCSGRKNQQRS